MQKLIFYVIFMLYWSKIFLFHRYLGHPNYVYKGEGENTAGRR